MRIISIKLKNLNSLRGEHSVRFDVPPLENCGLFAIVGPTGAGKSTLLDAITLALYDRTARFGGTSPGNSIISHEESEGFAEVCFETKGKTYTAKWYCVLKTKKTGIVEPQIKLTLWETDTLQIIAEKKSEVPDKIAQITGLDADKFLRSVLLAQGQFNKFIFAKPQERAELLEKLTGAEIYTRIAELVREKFATKQESLRQLEFALNEIKKQLLTDEQHNEITQNIEQHQATLTRLAQERQAVESLITQLKDLAEREEATLKAKQNFEIAQKKYIEFQAGEESKIDLHQKAITFQPDLQSLTYYEAEQNEAKIKEQKAISDFEKAQINHNESNKKLNDAKKQEEIAEQNYKDLLPKIRATLGLDKDIQACFDKVKSIESELKSLQDNFQMQYDLLNQKAKEIHTTQQKKENAENYITQSHFDARLEIEQTYLESEATKLLQKQKELIQKQNLLEKQKADFTELNKTLQVEQENLNRYNTALQSLKDEIENLKNEKYNLFANESEEDLHGKDKLLAQRQQNLTNLKKYANDFAVENKALEDLEKQKKEDEQKLRDYSEELVVLEKKLSESKQNIENLELALKQAETLAGVAAYRAALVPGEPCPLCGSEHHPYHIDAPAPEIDKIKGDLAKAKSNEKKLDSKNIELQKEISKIGQKLNNINENIGSAKKRSDRAEADFNELANTFLSTITIFDDLSPLESQTAVDLKETQAKLNAIQKLSEKLNNQEKRIEKGRGEIEKVQATINVLEKDAAKMQAELEANIKQIEETQSALNVATQALDDALKPFQLNRPTTDVTLNLWKDEIKKRINNYKNANQTIEEAKISLTKLNTEVENLKQNLENIEQNIKTQKELLGKENEKLSGLKTERKNLLGTEKPEAVEQAAEKKRKDAADQANTADRANIEAREKFNYAEKEKATAIELAQTKTEQYQDFLQKILANAQQKGFASLSDLKQAILSEEKFEQLTKQKEKLAQEYSNTQILYNEKQSDYQIKREQTDTARPLLEVERTLDNLKVQQNEFSQKIGQAKQQIERNKQNRANYESQKLDLDAATQALQPLTELVNLIAPERKGGGKDKFKMYAQSLTFKYLVQLANQHMFRLQQRYYLQSKNSIDEDKFDVSKGLDLEIVDSYQADNARDIKTLSGGETFLTSLALALGLSEMAAQNSSIDTLFIDEGFGTLDNETLESALATLDALQYGGKTVGVISHIEEMKERIPVKIEVRPIGSGNSKITVTPAMN